MNSINKGKISEEKKDKMKKNMKSKNKRKKMIRDDHVWV
jgi:hypothetical protein